MPFSMIDSSSNWSIENIYVHMFKTKLCPLARKDCICMNLRTLKENKQRNIFLDSLVFLVKQHFSTIIDVYVIYCAR